MEREGWDDPGSAIGYVPESRRSRGGLMRHIVRSARSSNNKLLVLNEYPYNFGQQDASQARSAEDLHRGQHFHDHIAGSFSVAPGCRCAIASAIRIVLHSGPQALPCPLGEHVGTPSSSR